MRRVCAGRAGCSARARSVLRSPAPTHGRSSVAKHVTVSQTSIYTQTYYRDRCETCVCREGRVQCQGKVCPPVSCSHPREVECCKTCDGKSDFTQTYYRDRCETCVCREGRVQCQGKVCPPVSCSHPREVECCKTCDGKSDFNLHSNLLQRPLWDVCVPGGQGAVPGQGLSSGLLLPPTGGRVLQNMWR